MVQFCPHAWTKLLHMVPRAGQQQRCCARTVVHCSRVSAIYRCCTAETMYIGRDELRNFSLEVRPSSRSTPRALTQQRESFDKRDRRRRRARLGNTRRSRRSFIGWCNFAVLDAMTRSIHTRNSTPSQQTDIALRLGVYYVRGWIRFSAVPRSFTAPAVEYVRRESWHGFRFANYNYN